MWGLSRTLVDQHGRSASPTGFEETLELVGVGYRAAMKGQALSLQLGFSHDVDIAAARRHHLRRAQADRDQDLAASTSRRSARSPPRSAASVRPSPTRARASATRAKRSAARKARRSKPWLSLLATPPSAAPQRTRTRLQGGGQRPSAPVGLPFGQEHLRPGHRRRERRHAGRRLLAGRREGQEPRAPTRTPPPASASWSPSAPSKRASRTSSSTAAATSITAG